jgi:hypothetical protein
MSRVLELAARSLGALILIAVQLHSVITTGGSLVNFFSYFTIESNLFAAGVVLFAPRAAVFRAAATLYMTIVGIVFALVLAGDDSLLAPWINLVFHYVAPSALVLWWLLDPPHLRSSYATLVTSWLAFPVAFALYSLVRGAMTGWYPYPFLDPVTAGAGGVAAAIAAIGIGSAVLACAIIAYARRRSTARGR